MWALQHDREFQASAGTVWAWYEDTASAPSWDPLIGEIRCDGPLAVGVAGRNKPRRGPSAPFVYTEVTPGVSYTEETKLPGARMAFWHTLRPRDAVTIVTHGVMCTGPLAQLYRLLVRRSFDAGMVRALEGLAVLAEAGPPTAAPGVPLSWRSGARRPRRPAVDQAGPAVIRSQGAVRVGAATWLATGTPPRPGRRPAAEADVQGGG